MWDPCKCAHHLSPKGQHAPQMKATEHVSHCATPQVSSFFSPDRCSIMRGRWGGTAPISMSFIVEVGPMGVKTRWKNRIRGMQEGPQRPSLANFFCYLSFSFRGVFLVFSFPFWGSRNVLWGWRCLSEFCCPPTGRGEGGLSPPTQPPH